MEMRFDPMTGEPINPQPQENDAQTQEAEAQKTDAQGINAGTQQPPYMPQTPADAPKNKNWIKGLAIAGGTVVVVAVAAVAVKNAMIGKGGKVIIAAANTFKDTPTIIKESNLASAAELLAKGKYTVTASFDVSGDGFEGKLVSTPKEKQLSGYLDIDGISADGVVGISDTELKAYIPLISDDTYVYNFEDDNQEGYLVDLIEDSGIDIEDVNNALRQVTSIEEKAADKSTRQLEKDLLKEFNSLNWEKADAKSCRVDGKTRKVKGYKVEVTGDDVESMVEILEDYYKNQLDDMDYLRDFNLDVDDIEDMFDEIYDLCGYMDDVDLELYIYKNKLAAVYVDDGSNTGEILFEGGDYRLQNVECSFENDYDDISFEIAGSSKGSVENLEFIMDGDTVFELEYDSKSGDFTAGNDYDYVDGSLKKNGKGFDFSVDYDELNLSLSMTADTKLEKYEGDEIDVTELDEDDIRDLVMDFYDNVY